MLFVGHSPVNVWLHWSLVKLLIGSVPSLRVMRSGDCSVSSTAPKMGLIMDRFGEGSVTVTFANSIGVAK